MPIVMKQKLAASRFFAILPILTLGSSKWVPDPSCLPLNKSVSEMRKFAPWQDHFHLLHTCNEEETKPFSVPTPKNMRWSLSINETRPLWYGIVQRMKGKKLVLVGDSLMYQTIVGLVIYLDSIGISCTHFGNIGYKCGDGHQMEIHRPWFRGKLRPQFLSQILPAVMSADIAIVSVGLHYIQWACTNPQNSIICEDVRDFFNNMTLKISKHQTNVSLAWMDAYRPHFPAPKGEYLSWKNTTHEANNACRPIAGENVSYTDPFYTVAQLMKKEYPHIPVVSIYDMTFDRYDMHTGVLTHYDPKRLDCVHLCMQPCYWEAIALRLGTVIDRILDEKRGEARYSMP